MKQATNKRVSESRQESVANEIERASAAKPFLELYLSNISINIERTAAGISNRKLTCVSFFVVYIMKKRHYF